MRVRVHAEGAERVLRRRRVLQLDEHLGRLVFHREGADGRLADVGEGVALGEVHHVGVGAQTKVLQLSLEHLHGSASGAAAAAHSQRCLALYAERRVWHFEVEPRDAMDREEAELARRLAHPLAESILEMVLLAWMHQEDRPRRPLGAFAPHLAVTLGEEFHRWPDGAAATDGDDGRLIAAADELEGVL